MNNYFDKIYVLSLRREIERRKKISERLGSLNIKFEFFDAIEGSILTPLWKSLNNSYFQSPNYMACLLSHLAIYKDAISNNYQRILILEDDAVPKKSLNEDFAYIINQIPEDYDILYLGYIPLDDPGECWDYTVLDNRFISNNIFNSKNLWGTYAISLSNSMMSEMLELHKENLYMEIDRYFVMHPKKFYGTLPQLFCHDINVSANAGEVDYSSWRKSIHYRYPIEDYMIN